MSKEKGKDTPKEPKENGFLGLLGGFGAFIDKLGELAEKGEQLRKSGEFKSSDPAGKVRGVYGFSVKVGLGNEDDITVEPFGNVHKDEATGKTVVAEVREPMVDIFDEQDHVLIVAEMPGIAEADLILNLKEDILTITAGQGDKKYHKEVLLPSAFPPEKMSHTCRNGVLEVKISK